MVCRAGREYQVEVFGGGKGAFGGRKKALTGGEDGAWEAAGYAVAAHASSKPSSQAGQPYKGYVGFVPVVQLI